MNHEGDLTPPQPEPTPGASFEPSPAAANLLPAPSRPWFVRYRLLMASGGGLLAVGAVAAAAVLFLGQVKPTIEKMVPASDDVLVIANLDPSLAQKVNLLRAVHSFPDTRTDGAISNKLDEAVKALGLSFSSDVQPWLAGEIGVSGTMNFASSADSPFAVFATSRDDTKATAALAKFRSGTQGRKYSWHDETYNGVSIASGTPNVTSVKPVAYSYLDHVVVVASSAAMIHEVIDTDQGRSARLVDTSDFKATMKLLPSDRVAVGYVAGKSLVAGVKTQMAKSSTLGLPALKTVDELDALQGVGGAISATGTGVAFDLAVKLDTSKLSPATREAIAATGHPDAVLRWIPKASDGFLAIANVDKSIKSLLQQYGSDPSVKTSTDAVGLTGPTGILPHLTGDLGLELEVGKNSIPTGALLIGTNDATAMNAFFRQILGLGAEMTGQNPSTGITRTAYRGAVITAWRSPSLSTVPGLVPSYAALDGMGIVASSPAEIKAVIDAHLGSSTITTDATYQAVSAGSLGKPAGIMYVNVAQLVTALGRLAPSSAADTKTMAYLGPIKAFMFTATGDSGGAVDRFFVAIQ
jgi:Protein of unknown function (DUF3352)